MHIKRAIIIILYVIAFQANGQEFRSTVTINYQKLQTTTQGFETSDTKIFETMKQMIEDFINGRKWTNLEFENQERLDCTISIVLNERSSATNFGGQLQIQLRRPVYNSNYTSGLFNHIETSGFQFSFNESQTFEFDPNSFYDNLTSVLAYYCYIMLGIYFDSFGPDGGQGFYEVARSIAQIASSQAGGYKGWSSTDGSGQKARYWFMENHTNSAYEALHSAYYYYYRLGLDMMTRDQNTARQNILQALKYLQQVHKVRTNLLSVNQFIEVNISEIISIFTPAPADEKKVVYGIIRDLSPINATKIRDWNS